MKWKIDLRQIRNSRFLNDTRFGFCGRLATVLGIPLILTWLMFDPFTRIELKANTNEPQFISRTQIQDDLTRTFIAEFLQTSLQLGWYQICFENHGALTMGGKTIIDRPDRGDVQIQVREVLPEPYTVEYDILQAWPFEQADCKQIGNAVDGINVGTSTVNLGARINDQPGDMVMLSDKEFRMDFAVDFTKMRLYIRQDWLAFGVKYLVVVVLWSSLILWARSVWEFLTGTVRKTA
ncbi:MAG TPA: hypothetical protein VNM40_01570 [Candidatus Paceibacterota bacterium]|nr:hypothetical protein [Candidatus Paceibacterota bacterium]